VFQAEAMTDILCWCIAIYPDQLVWLGVSQNPSPHQDRILTESIMTTMCSSPVCIGFSKNPSHNLVWTGFLQKPSPSLCSGVQLLKYKHQCFSLKNWNLLKAFCFERLLCAATLFSNDLYMHIVIYFVVFKVHLLLHSLYNCMGHT